MMVSQRICLLICTLEFRSDGVNLASPADEEQVKAGEAKPWPHVSLARF